MFQARNEGRRKKSEERKRWGMGKGKGRGEKEGREGGSEKVLTITERYQSPTAKLDVSGKERVAHTGKRIQSTMSLN